MKLRTWTLLWLLLAGVFWLGFASGADAHRIPKADAESRWYYLMKSQCDIGGNCSVRKVLVRCTAGAPHSYNCTYEYRQSRPNPPFDVEYRYCTVYGVLKHSTAVTSTRNCGAWS